MVAEAFFFRREGLAASQREDEYCGWIFRLDLSKLNQIWSESLRRPAFAEELET